MAVKMRLTRMGKKRNPIYRIIVADARSPRDGKFIDEVHMKNKRRMFLFAAGAMSILMAL